MVDFPASYVTWSVVNKQKFKKKQKKVELRKETFPIDGELGLFGLHDARGPVPSPMGSFSEPNLPADFRVKCRGVFYPPG